MPRFFVDKDQIDGSSLRITGDDARHIARSLRMAVGDEVTVSDKAGTDYHCSLERIRDDEVICNIIYNEESSAESPINITLYMAYPKADKLETVIQKAVELGASEIVPFESQRCIKRPGAERAEKIRDRQTRIAEEAAKQCGRSILPTVAAVMSFKDVLEYARKDDLLLFCYEGAGAQSLRSVLAECRSARSIGVFVGSEGGFAPEEAESAREAGARIVNLGPRILRCETAPMYVLSSISYEFELKK